VDHTLGLQRALRALRPEKKGTGSDPALPPRLPPDSVAVAGVTSVHSSPSNLGRTSRVLGTSPHTLGSSLHNLGSFLYDLGRRVQRTDTNLRDLGSAARDLGRRSGDLGKTFRNLGSALPDLGKTFRNLDMRCTDRDFRPLATDGKLAAWKGSGRAANGRARGSRHAGIPRGRGDAGA
jgi:hypothetical protein